MIRTTIAAVLVCIAGCDDHARPASTPRGAASARVLTQYADQTAANPVESGEPNIDSRLNVLGAMTGGETGRASAANVRMGGDEAAR